ncbi:MAG: VOC family protein [Kofleriaceae bacterium]|nr:VOC family protein [Kofleriaceae bacterium]
MSHLRHVLTILAVDELVAHAAFYQTVLGCAASVTTPVYVEFLVGAQRIGLYQREGFGRNIGELPGQVPAGMLAPTELYFHTDDIMAAIDRMHAAGARQLSALAPRPWGDRAAYFADLAGNIIVLAQSLPPDVA